mmetsp:Transcript_9957/g.25407  ORF Transcript_9957/g.25407 Transcript_9957/m.25407 type:complete len:434 (+) Transcript_9957:597-1898(+)
MLPLNHPLLHLAAHAHQPAPLDLEVCLVLGEHPRRLPGANADRPHQPRPLPPVRAMRRLVENCRELPHRPLHQGLLLGVAGLSAVICRELYYPGDPLLQAFQSLLSGTVHLACQPLLGLLEQTAAREGIQLRLEHAHHVRHRHTREPPCACSQLQHGDAHLQVRGCLLHPFPGKDQAEALAKVGVREAEGDRVDKEDVHLLPHPATWAQEALPAAKPGVGRDHAQEAREVLRVIKQVVQHAGLRVELLQHGVHLGVDASNPTHDFPPRLALLLPHGRYVGVQARDVRRRGAVEEAVLQNIRHAIWERRRTLARVAGKQLLKQVPQRFPAWRIHACLRQTVVPLPLIPARQFVHIALGNVVVLIGMPQLLPRGHVEHDDAKAPHVVGGMSRVALQLRPPSAGSRRPKNTRHLRGAVAAAGLLVAKPGATHAGGI